MKKIWRKSAWILLLLLVGMLALAGCNEGETENLCAAGHSYGEAVTVKEATCVAKGETSQTCSVCGDVKVTSLNALGHLVGEWVTDTAPTCTQKGSRSKSCTGCGEAMETGAIAATGHNKSDWIIDMLAACEKSGKRHKECTTCGEELDSDVLDATGHRETKLVMQKPATCTEDGINNRVCTACDKVVRANIKIPATGHPKAVWQLTDPATCTADGEEKLYCPDCEDYTGDVRTIDATGHTDGEHRITQEGDCVTDEIANVYCGVCLGFVRTEIKESTGHVLTDWITDRKATCTEDGLAYKSCTVCETAQAETKALPATGHQKSPWQTDKDVTCEEDGHRQRVCLNEGCGAVVEQEIIGHEGHKEGEWQVDLKGTCTTDGHRQKFCTVCDTLRAEEIIPATGHTRGRWQIDREATCTEDGHKTADCTVCSAEDAYSEVIPATGHTDGEWVIHTAVTCTSDGLKQCFCTVCGVLSGEEPIFSEGHRKSSVRVLLEPTCLEAGEQDYYCTVCEKSLEKEPIEALGHALEWTVDQNPACEKDGSKHADCTREGCGATNVESESIPATGHKAGAWVTVTPAGCESYGECKRFCTVENCGVELQSGRLSPTGHSEGEWRELSTDVSRMELPCASCGTILNTSNKEDVVITSGTTSSVNLAGYRIVYPANASNAFVKRVTALAERLSYLTGSTVTAVSDATSATAKEIVIGNTSRAQTATARAAITGHGFAVILDGTKIAIAGSTELIAQMGVEYFVKTYLGEGATATVTLHQRAVSDRYATVTLDGSFRVVYDKDLDTDNTHEVGYAADPDNYSYDMDAERETYYGYVNSNGTGRDYAYDAALAIRDQLAALVGGSPVLCSDATAAKATEILVGRPDREAVVSALAELAAHEYGILVRNGRVIVTGYGTEALRVAAPLFVDHLADAKAGDGSIVLPANFTLIETVNDNWLTDFPLPEGLPLYNAEDAGDSSFQYLYMGDGVTLNAHEAYCNKLLAGGYKILTESTLEGSYFKTFTDKATASKLVHVCYNAFAWAGKYELDTKADAAGSNLPASWFKFEEKEYAFTSPQIRIVSAYVNEEILAYPKPGTSIYSQKAPNSDTVEYIYYNKNYPNSYSSSQSYDKYFNTTYRNNLTNAGFTILFSSTAGEIPFFTAVNKTTGVEITVELHMNGTLTVNKTEQTWSYLRLLVKRQGTVTLPSELLNPNQSYTKVTDSAITAIALDDGAVGTGYVITLEDGRFVIIDGGSASYESPQKLWAILTGLYYDIWGREPSPEHPVEIAAWIITHGHGDHMNNLWDFSNYYGGGNGGSKIIDGGVVRVKYLIANIPELSTVYNTGETSMSLRYEMLKIHDYFKYGFTFVKVQTGQKLYLANLEIHTLITHSDLNPQRIITFNDTSAVMRLTFTPTSGGTKGTPVTLVSTGDAYIHGGRWLCAMYGEALKSDMVTLAHHGGPGVEKAFYKLVAPRVVWWPHTAGSIYYYKKSNGTVNAGYLTANTWHSKVDQFVVLALQSVDYVYIADRYNLTLDLTFDGPTYERIRNAGDTAVIGSEDTYTLTKNVTSALLVTKRPEVPVSHEQFGLKHEIHNKKPIIIKKKS